MNGRQNTEKKQRKLRDDLTQTFVTESADDDGNAKCAYAMFGTKFLYCEAFGWMCWTGTHWRQDNAEASIDRAIVEMLKARRLAAVHADKEPIVKATAGTARHVRDCRSMFRSMITVNAEEFDCDLNVLNVANGVLDLRSGELAPHSPEQRFTYCIDIEYDETADDTTWREFLTANVAGGELVQDYLQMAVGYSLTGYTSEECLWYIYGPSRSGKGIFTEVLLAIMRTPLGMEVDFATFTAKRDGDTQNFDLAPLKPTRLVVTSESNRYETLNAGKIKQLTGGNYVRAAYKHRDLFTYRPQFKAWLVSNQPVNADVDDDALWHRVKVLEFPNSHIGSEDKTLKPRMKSKETLKGVLRWAVSGAKLWYANEKGLEHPSWVKLSTKAHRVELDFVAQWLEERCVEDALARTENKLIYTNYELWCKANGIQPKAIRMFTTSLKNKGFAAGEVWREGERTVRGVIGLRLVPGA